jgi:hypothetical protein
VGEGTTSKATRLSVFRRGSLYSKTNDDCNNDEKENTKINHGIEEITSI